MKNAIRHLENAAKSYRSMTTPDGQVTTEEAALRNAELADEFEAAAQALRKLEVPNGEVRGCAPTKG